MSFIHIDDLTDWIVDPDPTTLRIGQECEAAFKMFPEPYSWEPNFIILGHKKNFLEDPKPWLVDENGSWSWAYHIRIKKPVEEPTTLVPMAHGDANRLRMMAKDLQVNWGMYAELLIDLADRIEAHLPKPAPQRPEIEIDDPVRVRDETYELWEDAHFAGWDKDGDPTAWANGRTSHTSAPDDVYSYKIIKTQDGTIWKGDTN